MTSSSSGPDDKELDRDECWFLGCTREPEGVLYGEDGFGVAACEQHGVTGEAFGWKRFDRSGNSETRNGGNDE